MAASHLQQPPARPANGSSSTLGSCGESLSTPEVWGRPPWATISALDLCSICHSVSGSECLLLCLINSPYAWFWGHYNIFIILCQKKYLLNRRHILGTSTERLESLTIMVLLFCQLSRDLWISDTLSLNRLADEWSSICWRKKVIANINTSSRCTSPTCSKLTDSHQD